MSEDKTIIMHFADGGGEPDPDQAPNENEKFYDAEIAPVLRELGKKCEDRKMAFIAIVSNGGDTYRTTTIPAEALKNPSVRVSDYATRCYGNIDKLYIALEQDADKYGHNSAYLQSIRWNRESAQKK